MINMEFAKFMFKYSNQILPDSFDNYFIKLENVHNYSITLGKRIASNFINLSFLQHQEKNPSTNLPKIVVNNST